MTKKHWLGLCVSFVLCFVGFSAPTKQKPTVGVGNSYRLLMTQVKQLKPGDAVQIGGVVGGYVEDIVFAPAEIKEEFELVLPPGQVAVLVTVNLALGTRIPMDSQYNVISNREETWLAFYPGKLDYYANSSDILYSSKDSESIDVYAGLKHLSLSISSLQKALIPYVKPGEEQNIVRKLHEVKLLTDEGLHYTQDLDGNVERLEELVVEMDENMAALQLSVRQNLMQYEQIALSLTRTTSLQIAYQQQALEEQGSTLLANMEATSKVVYAYASLLEEFANKWTNEENAQQFVEMLHKWAETLEEQAEIAETLHYVSEDPGVQKALRDMVHQLKLRADALKVKALQVELLFDRDSLSVGTVDR